jgi:MFS family permease
MAASSNTSSGNSSIKRPFELGRNFLLYASSRFLATTASYLLQAAIAWQVYQISGSALQLGMLGLARFLPALAVSLVGGLLADAYNRRRIILATQPASVIFGAILLGSTFTGTASLALIYAVVVAVTLVGALEQPARQALLPLLVRRELFPTAVTVNSTLVQLSIAAGPALAGVVIAAWGLSAAYALYLALVLGSIAILLIVRIREGERDGRPVSFRGLVEGVQFVWRNQPVLGAMSLDMFSVIFAGAQALLPIYASDILQVGPRGYGLLASSQAVGAFVTSAFLAFLPPIKQSGRALLISVACFGLATIVFGFSRSFPLSLAVYTLSGVADQVNVVLRHTIIQLSSPDHLRGRVSSISGLFVGTSNHIGMLESGLIAALTSATFSVVSGGIGCIIVVAVIAARMPELRRYRAA